MSKRWKLNSIIIINFNILQKVFRADVDESDGCPPIVAFLANQADKWEVRKIFSLKFA